MNHTSVYTGKIVRERLLDTVIVTDADGGRLCHRPLPLGAILPKVADIALYGLGYRRISEWDHDQCRVQPR